MSDTPKPFFNRYGDSLVYLNCDEESVGDYVDKYLLLYRSANDNRIMGCTLSGVSEFHEVGREHSFRDLVAHDSWWIFGLSLGFAAGVIVTWWFG